MRMIRVIILAVAALMGAAGLAHAQVRTVLQSQSTYPLTFALVSSADHSTLMPNQPVIVTLMKAGSSIASSVPCHGAVVQTARPGIYALLGDATDSNTLGTLWLHAEVVGSNANAVDQVDLPFEVVANDIHTVSTAPSAAVITAAVWNDPLPGSHASGTAGHILGTAVPDVAFATGGGLLTSGTGANQIATDSSGRVTIGAIASGVITAGSFASGAFGAVWDIVLASHLTAGSTGAALNSASAAGDPWAVALPGAYGVGTAGHIVGTALPDIAPGSANGLVRAGTNTPIAFSGSGDAFTITSTGGNGKGFKVTGNGTGVGFSVTGGSAAEGALISAGGVNSAGLHVAGGSSSADGIYVTASRDAISCLGNRSGLRLVQE